MQSCAGPALSCVDGSFYARVNLSDFDVCRLRSCVRPFDAVDITAGLDEVRRHCHVWTAPFMQGLI